MTTSKVKERLINEIISPHFVNWRSDLLPFLEVFLLLTNFSLLFKDLFRRKYTPIIKEHMLTTL